MVEDWRRFEWMGLHKAMRTIVIEGTVVNYEPIRIGAGPGKARFEPVDAVVIKIYDPKKGDYIPFIPGSSWKGLFRASAVRVARSRGLTEVCDGIPRKTCLEGREFDGIERRNLGMKEVEEKVKSIIRGEISICPVCLIFGSPGILSHITVYDSIPTSNYKLGYRTCVAIDRRTGSAAKGALYSIEYVEPMCRFSFRLDAENTPNYCLGLISRVLYEVNYGVVRVGGSKSRGFGRVKIEDLKIKVYSLDHEKYGVHEKTLRGLDPIDKPVPWPGSPPERGMARVEGEKAWNFLDGLMEAWKNSLSVLKEISREGKWRWELALQRIQT